MSALAKIVWAFLVASQAYADSAAPVAPNDCWRESGNPLIVDGVFVVYVDAAALDKSELLATLGKLSADPVLRPAAFPLVGAETVEFELKATASDERMARGTFIANVGRRTRRLQALAGVRIECELTMGSNPAVSGSNG